MQELIERNQMFNEEIYSTRLKMQQFVLDQEIWKPVDGFDYSISSKGRVRNDKFNRLMVPCKNSSGYMNLTFYKNCKIQNATIHRL